MFAGESELADVEDVSAGAEHDLEVDTSDVAQINDEFVFATADGQAEDTDEEVNYANGEAEAADKEIEHGDEDADFDLDAEAFDDDFDSGDFDDDL